MFYWLKNKFLTGSSIGDLIKKGREYKNTIVAGLILILIFFLGMGIGMLIRQPKSNPIIIDKNVKIGLPFTSDKITQKNEFSGNPLNFAGSNFVASINGKAYYPKGCKSANVIKEENRIWFESAEEAEEEGYALAKNCQ